MGAFTSRQNAAVEEAEQNASNAYKYKYPPRSGNFFGSHFIMGGERFDQTQPESYLFGENADLNFLGSRPTAFPYPPPQANEPTKTLKSLVNIRKESVRFVRTIQEKYSDSVISGINHDDTDGNICSSGGELGQNPSTYNIEFTFDSDAKCAITIYYFCVEEVSPSGVTLMPNANGLTSETYHYDKGINQFFSQPSHVFNPQLIPEDDLIYNPGKEQYPVAIHCVVEEGNEDCRQSHTTICVIDHHPDSNSYSLRALKQKIFVDGLCYLLQEIYGIENKAVNKSSIDDEEIDDHGSECVICMSETRDTLILPCRHLCLCNSCADSLRYQANNCPICRAPFRALLQIRAVQKGITTHMMHQNLPAGGTGEPTPCDQHIPSGYFPVSLIESLNGPPQYVTRSRLADGECPDGPIAPPAAADGGHKANSPHKPNGQRRSKVKKNVSTSTSNTCESGQPASESNVNPAVSIEIGSEDTNETTGASASKKQPSAEKLDRSLSRSSQDKLHIVNERSSVKLPKSKRSGSNVTAIAGHNNNAGGDGDDDDSENEKLSPLLSPSSRCKSAPTQSGKALNISDMDGARNSDDNDNEQCEEMELQQKSGVLKMHKCNDSKRGQCHETRSVENVTENVVLNAEDSDYYTPEDTQNSILSPLCPDRIKSADKLGSLKGNCGSIRGVNNLAKKNLHKKSTSVGNIVGPAGGAAGTSVSELKGNVSSLPDMLDSPISGNTASTRSSSDSYSSSSSTKQLLSSTNTTAAANIIVDDKTALQNAVNV